MYFRRPYQRPEVRQKERAGSFCDDKYGNFAKLSKTERQFLKWIISWEKRVFKNDKNILQVRGNCFYRCNSTQLKKMETYFKTYQENNSKVLGQDRFIWTVFANGLITTHKNNRHTSNEPCTTKLSLFVLLWSSFYLDLPDCKIQELLQEVLICTHNLKFMFSFLPGTLISSFITNFVSDVCDEKVMCEEFFVNIEMDIPTNHQDSINLYQASSPLILYLVKHLVPLHSDGSLLDNDWPLNVRGQCGPQKYPRESLLSVLDKTVDHQQRHTVLTLAIQHRDKDLIKQLLRIGASADTHIWDPSIEEFLFTEQMLITSINSLVACKFFFTSLSNDQLPSLSTVLSNIDSASEYGRMLIRSLLRPSARKADNVWRGESWQNELNSEIADEWGIGYQRSFPTLLHSAKISIRKHILRTDRVLLPVAISELPLPNLLKSYLNLELD